MKNLYKCDLCGSANLEFVEVIHDYNRGFKGNFDLYKCKNCELMFLNPQPTVEENLKYYTSDYYQKIDEGTGIKIVKIVKNFKFSLQKLYAKNPNTSKILFPFSQFVRGIKIIQNGRYLDVGCGNGTFLYNLKKINPTGEYYGVEPGNFNEEDIKAHGLNVIRGTLEYAHYLDNYFDVITLNHVFEHVPNPSETMKELKRILKPGGTLIIAVPNLNSFAYKIFGKFFYQLDVPRHLFDYSDKNLNIYASKFNFKHKVKMRYGAFGDQTTFIVSVLHWISSKIGGNIWIEFHEKMIKGNLFIIMIFAFLYVALTPLTLLLNLLKFGDSVEIWMIK